MSWDIHVMDIPSHITRIDEIPDDFQPEKLAARAVVVQGIRSVVPDVEFSDPTWGVIDGDGFSIEVNIGDEDPVNGFAFHVRGGGAAADVVAAILAKLGMRAYDVQAGALFDPVSARESFGHWQQFRDRVVGPTGS